MWPTPACSLPPPPLPPPQIAFQKAHFYLHLAAAAPPTDVDTINRSLSIVDASLQEFQYYNRLAIFGSITNETETLTDGLLKGGAVQGDAALVCGGDIRAV